MRLLEADTASQAAAHLQRLSPHRFDRVPQDMAELDALWEKTLQARAFLEAASDGKGDQAERAAAKDLLGQVRDGYAALDGDLEMRARRMADLCLGANYKFFEAKAQPTSVQQTPAVFLTASAPGRSGETDYVGFLMFEQGDERFAFCLHSHKPLEAQAGEELAATIQLGVDAPVAAKQTGKKTAGTSWTKALPRSAGIFLMVLVVAALPAGLGAASGYGSSRGPAPDRPASAAAGAFLFTGVGMAVGICIPFVHALSGIGKAAGRGQGMMAGVALLIFLAVYGFAALVAWFLTCRLASLGAKIGARTSRLRAALLAALLAGLGSLLVPAVFGFLS